MFCGFQHLGVAGAIQIKVAFLGIAGGGQDLFRRLQRPAAGVGQRTGFAMLHGTLYRVQRIAPGVNEHAAGILAGMGTLDECFEIVIIIFHPEYIYNIRIGRHGGKLGKGFRSCGAERLGEGIHIRLFQSGVAALGKHLCGVFIGAGFQHPLHAFPAEHPVFHAPEPGRNIQEIGILELRQAPSSFLWWS